MTKQYEPDPKRYEINGEDWFRRCGRTGLKLPAISLGCWHNFGRPGTDAARHDTEKSLHESAREMLFTAFDLGITHFDLANNYGPPGGAAEHRVGRILNDMPRDELIISTKAGYYMWPGPYGEWGSRKYLIASLDQSLQRLDLDYVDLYYSHRPDLNTPFEETLAALDHVVRAGKALYVGISSYDDKQTSEVIRICKQHNLTMPVIHQPHYNMLDRWIERGLTKVCDSAGMGIIAFCPLSQGLLTDKYLSGIPGDSRAGSGHGFLKPDNVKVEIVDKARKLNELAASRGQTLAQMALAWTLRDPRITSALIGASRPDQIRENVAAMKNPTFTNDELKQIDAIMT